MTGLSIWCGVRFNMQLGFMMLLFAIFFFIGLTKNAVASNSDHLHIYSMRKLGGITLGVGTFLGLGFLVVSGIWPEAMLSLYLCSIAVILSFLMGSGLGIWAALIQQCRLFCGRSMILFKLCRCLSF